VNELGARLRERDLTARSFAAAARSVAGRDERPGLDEHEYRTVRSLRTQLEDARSSPP
jgi:hypothetical protein